MADQQGFAFQDFDGTIDLDSIGETPLDVRLKVLQDRMGWRFQYHNDLREKEWKRLCQTGKVVRIVVRVEAEDELDS